MKADISETIKDFRISDLVYVALYAHKPPKPVAPTIFMLGKKLNLIEMY